MAIIGLKVTAVLLKRLILPIGGVALGRVCAQPVIQAGLFKTTYISNVNPTGLLLPKLPN